MVLQAAVNSTDTTGAVTTGDGRESHRPYLLVLMLTMALLAAMAAEAAVVVKARAALVQTRTHSHVIGLFTGDVPVSTIATIALDHRALMLNPEVIEATSAVLSVQRPAPAVAEAASAPAAFGGGTTSETFATHSPATVTSTARVTDVPVPQIRFASLELPVLPPPIESRKPAADAAAQAAMPPLLPPVPAEMPRALDTGSADQVLAMLVPPPLAGRGPPAELMPPPESPLLEPHMEVFEDWVTRAPMNRHPGFHKVHFAPNVQGRCLPKTLINVLYDVGMKFGDVKVISGYRSPSHNRSVGGATRSLRMECRAIDFFVTGSGSGVVDWLVRQKNVGGYKRYPFGSFHIDNGPRRTWAWGKKKKKRRR